MIISRIVRVVTAILLILAGTVVAAFVWVGSDDGRAWLVRQAEHYSEGAILISGLQGHPLSGLTAATIEYRDAQMNILGRDVEFNWAPMALFGGSLNILSLSVSALQIHELAGEEAMTGPGPDIPFGLISRLRLHAAHISSFEVFDPLGEAGVKLQNINVAELAFWPGLSGTAKLEAEGKSVQIELAGTLDDWELQLGVRPLQGLYPSVDLQLAGRMFGQGSMMLSAKLEQGAIQSDGQWTFAEGLIRGEGKLQADFTAAKGQGHWQIKVETDTSALQFALAGDVDAGPQLNRHLHLTANTDWEGGKLRGALHESGQALAAEWGYRDDVLQLKVRMNKWMVPLAQAAGVITGTVVASINTKTSAWKVEADVSEGKVAGLMASLNIAGEGDGYAWQLHRGNIALLGVAIDASGKGDFQSGQVQGHLRSENLNAVLALAGSKQGGGALDGDFRLSGSMIEPKLDWNVQLTDLQSGWANLGQLQSKGWLVLNRPQAEFSINAGDIHLEGGQSWQRLEIQATLQEQALSVQSTALGEIGWHIQVVAKGQGNIWAGKIRKLRLDYQNSSVLTLDGLPWRWHADQLQVPESNIHIANIPARISLELGNSGPQVYLKVPVVEAKALKPWLDNSMVEGIDGRLHLDIALTGTWETPFVRLKSRASRLSLQWPEADIDLPPPVFRNLQLSATYEEQLLRWQFSGNSSGESILRSEGRLPWLFSLRPWVFSSVKNRPGRAGFSLQLRDLAILQPLIPKLYPLVGNASVTLDVRDPFGKLQTDAALNLALTSLGIPELGLDMHGQVLVNWQRNRGSVDIEMKSGDGTLTVQGPVTWPLEKMPAINFKQFPVIQRPDQQVVIGGHLDMKQQKKQSWIRGKVTASQLNIEIPESQPKPTSDLEWSQQKDERKPGADLPLTQLDVTLNLGQAAEIYGRGMKMRLAGQLHLTGSMRKPHLTGELTIPKGGIDYRNIHLDVLPKSRLVFTGDPERPLLYVQAGRKIDNILIGVQIEGPADRLQSRLFSNPSMPDAEILAYLVTGRPLSSLGKNAAADALSVAGFLLGPGSALQDVQNKVQRSLGLDSMEVSAGTESSKVAVGKKIGKRTTVKLEETVAAGSTTAVTLEYLLTNSITVFARQVQNAAPTLGLRYRKEWTGMEATK